MKKRNTGLIACFTAFISLLSILLYTWIEGSFHPYFTKILLSLFGISMCCLIFFTLRRSRFLGLRRRILITFSMSVAIPTLIITIFSIYILNISVESWFDKKISKILNQSINVGKSYIQENVLQLKEIAISVSSDLDMMHYDLRYNSVLFSKVLNAQAELRSLDEAIVFRKSDGVIFGRTDLTFSLSFTSIPMNFFLDAESGRAVQIPSELSKILILAKLSQYDDVYLLISRIIDPEIIKHIDETNGTASEYFSLKGRIDDIQVEFSIIFAVFSLILLTIAILYGERFTRVIATPIKRLVIASGQVKNGDLSTRLSIKNISIDEIRTLTSAFNDMVSRIDSQQKELILAQKALAWSDVARRVAHEIMNPLTPIQLSCERLLRKFENNNDKELVKKCSEIILRNADEIRDIVSEFVNFARLPMPNLAICELISSMKELIESRRIINNDIYYRFKTNVEKFEFNCDISQINRVIVNLLLNAEQFLRLMSKKKEIDLIINVSKDRLSIIIEDTGIGFSDKIIESVAKPYFTTKPDGSGLGLAIADRIVFEHKGQIHISNNSSGGGMVELTFIL